MNNRFAALADALPESSPAITVVICTYNRLDCLKKAINSVTSQLATVTNASLLVIDDGSTDGTQQWMESAAAQTNLNCVYRRQENAGLSAARNLGWQLSSGEWIAYLDDDAIASPAWLTSVAAACAAAPAEIAVIGGPIRLKWEAPRPVWLPPSMEEWLTCFEHAGDRDTSKDRPLFRGANMICRRSGLAAVNGFSVKLGRKGSSLLSREECDLAVNLAALSLASYYEPSAWIWHTVHHERLKRSWFLRRVYWEGISLNTNSSYIQQLTPSRRRARAILYAAKKLLRPLTLLAACRFDRKDVQMEALSEICFHAGAAHGIWKSQ